MAFSMKKSMVAKIVDISLVMLLAACASEQRYKRQVNDSNEEYLKTPSLHTLSSPLGMSLPPQSNDYEIPFAPLHGAIGKDLDIQLPAQLLALPDSSR
ncbi:MAG: outer membrane protein assembly factor BamC [Sodalis sp. Psp]|nr:outer membrane protein assembly factor BamC [Sodalis sp. Psp]MCR3756589.1 outer membrane protein assembly factor BamC [Sodalis sp. Ppy]